MASFQVPLIIRGEIIEDYELSMLTEAPADDPLRRLT